MKRILLASASIVAFAGAASADGHVGISFTGDAELGYNDDASGDNDGFYSELDITIGVAAELDNGITAAATIDFEDLANGGGNNGDDYELSLTSSDFGLFYGDTNFAAQNIWVAAGSMASDNFSEADGEEAIRGEVFYNDITAQVSYVLGESGGTRNAADDGNQLSLGVSADFGNYNFIVAYQEESDEAAGFYAANGDFTDEEVFGISAATTISNISIRLAYADNSVSDSTGLEVSYPFGPVTATAFYVSESVGDDSWGVTLAYSEDPLTVTFNYEDEQGAEDWDLEGSYDLGNGLVVFAGVADEGDDYYVGGEYDLGSGAQLLVSYAEDEAGDAGDEIGNEEFQLGTTIELSFEF